MSFIRYWAYNCGIYVYIMVCPLYTAHWVFKDIELLFVSYSFLGPDFPVATLPKDSWRQMVKNVASSVVLSPQHLALVWLQVHCLSQPGIVI